MRRQILIAILVLGLLPLPARAESPERVAVEGEPRTAADPLAPVVTAENLMASERFWPYHVALVAPFRPLDREKPLPAGTRGVLIRAEVEGTARIDFGRDGIYGVPIGQTDLVAGANRVRTGEEFKMGPNAALAIGTKLTDSRGERLAVFKPDPSVPIRGFLCVFADPDAPGFAELAAALRPLQQREGVLTVLFPQGQHPDQKTLERLHALGWKVPFAFDFLSDSYTESFLPEGLPVPAVLLQTNEGRAVFLSSWKPDTLSDLAAALDAEFGTPDAAATAAAAPEAKQP